MTSLVCRALEHTSTTFACSQPQFPHPQNGGVISCRLTWLMWAPNETIFVNPRNVPSPLTHVPLTRSNLHAETASFVFYCSLRRWPVPVLGSLSPGGGRHPSVGASALPLWALSAMEAANRAAGAGLPTQGTGREGTMLSAGDGGLPPAGGRQRLLSGGQGSRHRGASGCP